MLGLDRGGSCSGMAFRVAAEEVREELTLIWRREMISGAYIPSWVTLHTQGGRERALTFVVNRRHPIYAGGLSLDEVAGRVGAARGWMGSSRDYLDSTVANLKEMGISDGYLLAVSARLAKMGSA